MISGAWPRPLSQITPPPPASTSWPPTIGPPSTTFPHSTPWASTAQGQRIGILGGSDMNQSYIDTFRSQFGLPPATVEQHLVGPDPGITASANEAALDVEWSGAIARRATIVYIYSANFNTAAQGAIDQNLATVLSESLSSCEPECRRRETA